jgi:hypothetical protein
MISVRIITPSKVQYEFDLLDDLIHSMISVRIITPSKVQSPAGMDHIRLPFDAKQKADAFVYSYRHGLRLSTRLQTNLWVRLAHPELMLAGQPLLPGSHTTQTSNYQLMPEGHK